MTNVAPISPRARLAALAAVASLQAACVTDANRCLPGFIYSSQYDACLLVGGDAGDAGDDTSPDAQLSTKGDSSEGEAEAAGDGGLGSSCDASGDCPGQASYCLKDPTAAASTPGICTIPGCTPAECTSGYACCDCTSAGLPSIAAWPKNVCTPSSNTSTLTAFGCSCP